MKTVTFVILGVAVAAGLWLFTGCEHRHTVVVHEERPVYVEPAPETVYVEPRPTETIIVQEAPPPIQTEVIPVAPGPGFIWIGGFWGYEGHHYVWHHGHYTRGPAGNVWVRDSWVHSRRGWEYQRGHWEGGHGGDHGGDHDHH